MLQLKMLIHVFLAGTECGSGGGSAFPEQGAGLANPRLMCVESRQRSALGVRLAMAL